MHRPLLSEKVKPITTSILRHYTAMSIIGDKSFTVPSVQEELAVTAKQKGYTKSHWISKRHVQLLNEAGYDIEVKKDEVPVQVVRKKHDKRSSEGADDESDDKEVIIDYYNIEQTNRPDMFNKQWMGLSKWAFGSAKSFPKDIHGQRFDPSIRLLLRVHMIKRNTRSTTWISEDQMKYFPTAKLQANAVPVKIAGLQNALYHLSDFRDPETGRNPISQWLFRKKHTAYSAVTGKPYAPHCQAILQTVASKRKYKHRHWVTASQMSKFVPPLKLRPNQKGVPLEMVDARTGRKSQVLAYNQKQLVQPRIVTVHINRLIGKTNFRPGKNTVVVVGVTDATDDEVKDALVGYGHIYQIQRSRPHIVLVNFIADASAKEVIEKAQGITIGRSQGVTFNRLAKKAEKPCRSMLLTGSCPIKERCLFNHDEEFIESIRKKQEERKSNPSFRSRGGRRAGDGAASGGRGGVTGLDQPAWNRGSGWGRAAGSSASNAGWGSFPQERGSRGGWGPSPARGMRGAWAQPTGRGGWGQPVQASWGQAPRGGWTAQQAPRGGWANQQAPRGGWGQPQQ